MTTASKLGGTRIPFERISELPKLKNRELVSIHRDGSVRYFAIDVLYDASKDSSVVAIVYNDVEGPTLPKIQVSENFKFNSTFTKCIFALRLVMARYVKRSFYSISIYRPKDDKADKIGIYKFAFAAELRLRSAL